MKASARRWAEACGESPTVRRLALANGLENPLLRGRRQLAVLNVSSDLFSSPPEPDRCRFQFRERHLDRDLIAVLGDRDTFISRGERRSSHA